MSLSSSAWRALIWKDFQQVKSALLLMTVGILAFQLIALVAWKLMPGNANPLNLQLVFCCMTPVVAVMACVGLLIGQERQMGGWAWSSSLPQSWRQALASKVCVGMGASLLTVIPLAIAPTTLWFLGYRIDPRDAAELMWTPAAVLLTMLEVGVFLSVAVLIFRDSLTGLVVGGIWTTIVQFGMATVGTYYFSRLLGVNPGTHQFSNGQLAVLASQIGGLLLLGCAALMWLFRWRWSYGQSTEITWRRRPAILPVANLHLKGAFVTRRAPPRNEFWMLVVHSLRSSLFLRMAMVVSVVIFVAVGSTRDPLPMIVLAIVGAALFGVTTFDADHNLQRYRFFADRGVTTGRFVTARLVPVVVIIGMLMVSSTIYIYWTADYRTLEQAVPMTWILFPTAVITLGAAFLIGAVSSLCFDRVVFSLAVTLFTVVGIAMFAGVTAQADFYRYDVFPAWYATGVWCTAPVSLLLGVLSLYWLAGKWMIHDAPRLPRYFAGIMPTLVLLPFSLPMLFGFLFLPHVPWQGVEIGSQVQQSADNRGASALLAMEQPSLIKRLSTETRPVENISIVLQDSATISSLLDNAIGRIYFQWDDAQDPKQVADWLEELEAALTEKTSASSEDAEVSTNSISAVPNPWARQRTAELIRVTAYLGDLLPRCGEMELAKRTWGINKRLQEQAIGQLPFPSDLSAQILSAHVFHHMLGKLNAEQLAQLGTASAIRDRLLPDAEREKSLLRLSMRNRASVRQYELRDAPRDWNSLQSGLFPWATRLIPTLRWRQERSLALELQQVLATMDADQRYEQLELSLLRDAFLQWQAFKSARAAVDARLSQLTHER